MVRNLDKIEHREDLDKLLTIVDKVLSDNEEYYIEAFNTALNYVITEYNDPIEVYYVDEEKREMRVSGLLALCAENNEDGLIIRRDLCRQMVLEEMMDNANIKVLDD